MSTIPTFSSDVHDNDFVHDSNTSPTHGGFNVDTPLDDVLTPTSMIDPYYIDEVLTSSLEEYNALNAFLQFQMQSPIPNYGSPTSFASISTHLLGFSLEDTLPVFSGPLGDNAQLFAAPPTNSSEGTVSVRRRGPNRRPRGAAFAKLMRSLPPDVQIALQQSYEGCCDLVNRNNNSAWRKHIFSNRHCGRLAPHQHFICPAYIAFHSKCKSAKAGRYESTERHCKICPGFLEMDWKADMFPVPITKREYRVIKIVRSTNSYDAETVSQALNIRDKMLRMMFDEMHDEMTLVHVYDAMNINADGEESFTF